VPQSSELAGGEGFTYEGLTAAFYMVALLAETGAPGMSGSVVRRVAVQQRDFGEPLDDVIVDFRGVPGDAARLSLQVKRSLTISDASSNKDFRDIIRDSWATLHKPDFREHLDRYGVAVGTIAATKARALTTLCELARESPTTDHFDARFSEEGNAGPGVRKVRDDMFTLLNEVKRAACSPQELHRFLAHFVLVQFEFLHEGATDPAAAITTIRNSLAPAEASKAPLVWSKLVEAARASAGKSGVLDRARLVRLISAHARLRGGHSLHHDLEILTGHASGLLQSIQDDVVGTRIIRDGLAAQLEAKLSNARLVQIRGLPGSGKSVLLRNSVQRAMSVGPVLFVKGDQLEGTSWRSFATNLGLSSANLQDLLVEIGAVGTPVLYVDAIDRVEKEHQPIILELVRTIVESPLLDNWQIVLSLRDTGIEPIRNWMGELVQSAGIETVEVQPLDDDEAEALAKDKPFLRTLLFGAPEVREIVRRPFFAKILSQTFIGAPEASTFAPRSEVDLIENWWARGGYNAAGKDALDRQRAIVELAGARARKLSQPIALNQLSAQAVGQVMQFVEDGILQQVRKGHTVRFAHDIFFEWGFFHALTDRGDDWLDEIRECGEPPAVARVVELLSQSEFVRKQDWAVHLDHAAHSKMRSQWTRAWLLGPLAASDFATDEDQYAAATFSEEFHFLKKALVWFQAEKTTPNTALLAGDLPPEMRLRYADLYGWPADFAAWGRFISFLVGRIAQIPPSLYPDVLAVFEVWQNALRGIRNGRSRAILTQCAKWLEDIDEWDKSKGQSLETINWNTVESLGNFRRQLTQTILLASIAEPSFAEDYLNRILADERIREERFGEIVGLSPTLAQSHPRLLVELTLKHLREELPDEKVARQREDARKASERRKRALAKPESERTRADELAIAGAFSRIGFQQFSYHDWDTLSIDRDTRNFWPVSPLREPFHSLFQASPADALLLLRELCNHAIKAWRQLHRHIPDSYGTPLPLQLTFPWGAQEFWGGDREYLWFRNSWTPKALGCGFMALEEWCFAELGRGRPVDELIQQIVEGNDCVAILGVAAMIAMQGDTIAEAVIPLVTSQRLLTADQNRMIQDLTNGYGNLLGFEAKPDKAHIEAIQAANAREVRKKQLSWLLQRHFTLGGKDVAIRVQAAVRAFVDALPFQIEEHRNEPAAIAHLTKQAESYVELVEPENYQAYQTEVPDQVAIVHVSPSASEPEQVAKAEKARLGLQEGNLWAWAAKSFETQVLGDSFTVAAAIELARILDSPGLFQDDAQEDNSTRRGAVAAAAAITLRFRDGASREDLAWAREVLQRAIAAPEKRDQFWSSSSIIPWHHSMFAARGLAADLAAGTADANAGEAVLGLVAHPLEGVSVAAIAEAGSLWEWDQRLSWAALYLAFLLCHISPRTEQASRTPDEPIRPSEDAKAVVTAAVGFYKSGNGWPELAPPPPAWARMDVREARNLRYIPIMEGDDDDGALEDDGETVSEVWAEPEAFWDYRFADKILPLIPVEQILSSPARQGFLDFISVLLSWTNQKNEPPGKKPGRRDHTNASLFEWTHELGKTLGRISGLISLDEATDRFLTPICALQGEACWSVLAPFVDQYICRYVLDAQVVPDGAIAILDQSLGRLLASPELDPMSHRGGEFSGFDQPRLARHLMFISVERAALAARYVNGDWSEIGRILPIIDRYVRTSGWSATAMGHFLTLCERAKANYPAEAFAEQVLSTLLEEDANLKGWHGTWLAARIAGLVQHFADRDSPLPLGLAQKFLRILDLLVDMGDRRSAALQFSEAFREIRASA